MDKQLLRCPVCGSVKIVKYGKTLSGHQRYYCRNTECPTKAFQLEYAYEGCQKRVDELLAFQVSQVRARKYREVVQPEKALRIRAL